MVLGNLVQVNWVGKFGYIDNTLLFTTPLHIIYKELQIKSSLNSRCSTVAIFVLDIRLQLSHVKANKCVWADRIIVR